MQHLLLQYPGGPVKSAITESESQSATPGYCVYLRPEQTGVTLFTFDTGKRVFALTGKSVVLTGDDLKYHVRRVRSVLLAKSDWTMMPDNGLTDEKRDAWKTYRQALRDLPEKHDLTMATPLPTQPQ